MKIVVLAGGLSTERNVSFSTGAMVCEALRRQGHDAVVVDLFLGLEAYPHPVEDLFRLPPPLPDPNSKEQEPDLAAVWGRHAAGQRPSAAAGFWQGCGRCGHLGLCRGDGAVCRADRHHFPRGAGFEGKF